MSTNLLNEHALGNLALLVVFVVTLAAPWFYRGKPNR